MGTVWVNCYDNFDAAAPFGGARARANTHARTQARKQRKLASSHDAHERTNAHTRSHPFQSARRCRTTDFLAGRPGRRHRFFGRPAGPAAHASISSLLAPNSPAVDIEMRDRGPVSRVQ